MASALSFGLVTNPNGALSSNTIRLIAILSLGDLCLARKHSADQAGLHPEHGAVRQVFFYARPRLAPKRNPISPVLRLDHRMFAIRSSADVLREYREHRYPCLD